MKGKENLGMEVDEERVKERGEVDRKDDKVDKNESPSFDDLLVVLGGFGRYQRWVYFFMFLPTIFSAMHKLAWVFLGAKVDHRQANILKLFFNKKEDFFFCQRCLLPTEDLETAEFNVSEEQRSSFLWDDEKDEMGHCKYKADNGSEFECDRGYVYDR